MKRLHPLVAIARALRYAASGAGFPIFAFGMATLVLGGSFLDRVPLIPLMGLGLLLGVGYGVLSYLAITYEVTEDTFDLYSGVIARREREIPHGRVQNVDVTRSFWQKLLGVAVVRIETAGGGTTEAHLDFVSTAEAERLERELRERRAAAREDAGAGTTTETGQADGEPGELTETPPETTPETERETRLLFRLSPTELGLHALTELRPATLFLLAIGTPLVDDLIARFLVSAAAPLGGPERLVLTALSPDEAIALSVVGVPLWIAGAWLLGAAIAFNAYHGFVLGRRGEDLIYERGLLSEYSGSIPEGKVQTLTVRENALQRALGYASLSIDTAGYAGQQARQLGDRSTVPLAERDRMRALSRAIVDVDFDVDFERPPKRARRRYAVRYALVVLLALGIAFGVARVVGGFSLWWTPALFLPLVPVGAHYKWRHRGYAVVDDHLLVRSGFWRRRTTIVPAHRLQVAIRSRTPFQRRLDLATLVADTASTRVLARGGATAHDLSTGDAAALRETLRERLQASLGGP